MKKEMLKVIRLNLTFFMCCLKKLAWHKRCWHTQSPGEVPAGCADNTNFHILMKFPRLIWTLMNTLSCCVQVWSAHAGRAVSVLCGEGPSCVF